MYDFWWKNITLTRDIFQELRFFSLFRIKLVHIRVSFIYQRRYTTLPHESLAKQSDPYVNIKPVITINLKTEIQGINNIEKYKINTKFKLNY